VDLDAVYLGAFLCWLSAVALLGAALMAVCVVERWRAPGTVRIGEPIDRRL
jgi:hypothetical protein